MWGEDHVLVRAVECWNSAMCLRALYFIAGRDGVDAVVFGIAVLEAVPFQGVFAGLVA